MSTVMKRRTGDGPTRITVALFVEAGLRDSCDEASNCTNMEASCARMCNDPFMLWGLSGVCAQTALPATMLISVVAMAMVTAFVMVVVVVLVVRVEIRAALCVISGIHVNPSLHNL